jgi:SOS response regulatory protein OraA/RecX
LSRPTPEDVALRALRAADRSRAELDARLQRKGFGGEERRQALDELERLGYVDDSRAAGLRAERLAERGYGDAYIRADLERRGLPAEDALAGVEPEPERIKRFGDKGSAWLVRRGFALEG